MAHSGMSRTATIKMLRDQGNAYQDTREAGLPPLPDPTNDGCRLIYHFGEQHALPPHTLIALLKRTMDEAGAIKKHATDRTDQLDAIRTVNAFADAHHPPLAHVKVGFVSELMRLPQIRATANNHRITRAQIEAITNDVTASHPATVGLTFWGLARIEPKIAENQPHPDDVFVLLNESDT